MKKNVLFFMLLTTLFTGCLKHDFPGYEENMKQQIDENVTKIFGTNFDPDHDWCTTTNGEVTVNGIPSDVNSVQVFAYVVEEGETVATILNEIDPNGESTVTLTYDAPANNLGIYVMFVSGSNFSIAKVEDGIATFGVEKARTRTGLNIFDEYTLPTAELKIGVIEGSYASERGWITGEKLYSMSDYSTQIMTPKPYSNAFKTVFRTVIFSYFKNGRSYNNLPLVVESGIYNDNAYPFTTGKEPIIVSPVYKRDGAGTYGNEVWNSDLYYFYYKGDISQFELERLPKYKAIPFNQHFGEAEDDVIDKRASYALIYWGDGTPEIGTPGSYEFPEGYKIGFMVRAKTDYAEGNPKKPRKQGELYADGRLNNNINNYSECNFKSSGLGQDAPRAAWITVNGRMLLCFESGTDKDFNDIIIEVEGGVIPIINIPDIESNTYTFCFEDTELGDYDMNDVVIKGKRINNTTVEYSVVACGALDNLKIMNINGNLINGNTEVHALFGKTGFINTQSQNCNPITERVTVDKKFSFLDESTQPYIYDITTGVTTKLSKKGEDPHGIMIPNDFKYPIEKICIKDAYEQFNNWGQNRVTSTDWYKYPNDELVF